MTARPWMDSEIVCEEDHGGLELEPSVRFRADPLLGGLWVEPPVS